MYSERLEFAEVVARYRSMKEDLIKQSDWSPNDWRQQEEEEK